MTHNPEISGGNINSTVHLWRTRLCAGFLALTAFVGLRSDVNPPNLFVWNSPDSEAVDPNHVKIMTANVHGWDGYNGNNFGPFMKVLEEENPDLVCAQEVDAEGTELMELREDGYNIIFVTTFEHPLDGRQGNAVISKAPLSLIEVIDLPNSTTNTPRKAVHFGLETDEGMVEFVNVHLGIRPREAQQQAQFAMDQAGQNISGWCGDTNLETNQMEDGAFGRMMAAGIPIPETLTFPANDPKREIDYILSDCAELDHGTEHPAYIDSDHLARIAVADASDCLQESSMATKT